jgi:hypothetical protein
MLLDRYRQQVKDNLWHTLPDDSYIYSHLTWHMKKAVRFNELHRLFQEVTTEGRNGWYERCNSLSLNARFVDDLRRAWELAKEMHEGDAPQSIVIQIRYALISSTLNSLSDIIPAKLIATLVQYEQWSPVQGLSYAKHSNPGRYIDLIKELAPYLPSALILEALPTIYNIPDEGLLAKGICSLVEYSPKNELQKMLRIACKMQGESSKSIVLSALIPYLPENVLLDVLRIVLEIRDGSIRDNLLNVLIPYLPENTLPNILEVALEMKDVTILSALSPRLSEEMLLRVLEIACELPTREYTQGPLPCRILLVALIPHLSETMLSKALGKANVIHNEREKAEVLGTLVLRLPEIMRETLKLSFDHNTNVLSNLLPTLPEHLLLEVLSWIRETEWEYNAEHIKVICSFVSPLSREILLKILVEIRKIGDDSSRARVLSTLVPYLPEIALECLMTARGLENKYTKFDVMSTLIPYLPDISSEVLEGIDKTPDLDRSGRSDILKNMMSFSSAIALKALDIASKIRDEHQQSLALGGLAFYLPELVPGVLAISSEITSEFKQAEILVCLAFCQKYLSEILTIAYKMENESFRAEVLSSFAPYISSENLPELLKMVRAMREESHQAKVLNRFIPCMSSEDLPGLLTVACEVKNESYRAKILNGLVSHMSNEDLPKLLIMVCEMESESCRAEVLMSLALHSSENSVKILVMANEINNYYLRVKVLSCIARYLPQELSPNILEMACRINNRFHRADVLSILSPCLSEDFMVEVVVLLLTSESEYSEFIDSKEEKYISLKKMMSEILGRISPYLPENVLPDIVCALTESDLYLDETLSEISHRLTYIFREYISEMRSEIRIHPSAKRLFIDAFNNMMHEPDENTSWLSNSSDNVCLTYDSFAKRLNDFSRFDRPTLLLNIPKLAPAIIHLSDRSTLNLVVQAMREVCQQWP